MHPTTVARLLITGTVLAALAGCSSAIPHKDEALASRTPSTPPSSRRSGS